VPRGDINCRDCDVRSLAKPELNRVFVKFKHLLRKAAARSAETICVIIGKILRAFTPIECANHFRNSRYAQFKKDHALVFVRLAHDRRLVAAVLFVHARSCLQLADSANKALALYARRGTLSLPAQPLCFLSKTSFNGSSLRKTGAPLAYAAPSVRGLAGARPAFSSPIPAVGVR
jgi:hypothetical protein